MAIGSPSRLVVAPFADFAVPKTPIHSLAVTQTLIHVGTANGQILAFSLNSPNLVAFERSITVSNRPVDSILAIPDFRKLLAVSDGAIYLLDSTLSHPCKKLGFVTAVASVTKRVAVDNSDFGFSGDRVVKVDSLSSRQKFINRFANGIVNSRVSEPDRLVNKVCYFAVSATPKKMLLVELSASESADDEISVSYKEFVGFDGVKAMAWVGNSIVVGNSEGYVLISAITGESSVLFRLPESSGPPRLKALWKSKEVLLLVDNVGVVVNCEGHPVGGSLIFQYVPDSIAEMGSYVVVARDGRMDLYRRKTGAWVQSLSFEKSGGVDRCIVANDDGGDGGVIVVALPNKAICFCKVAAEEQVRNLLRKKNFREAVCLLEEFESESEMTKEMLSFVHAQVGFLLIFALHFEDAVNHLLLSETMQPSEIFPFIMRDPNRWSHLVPRNKYWGLHPPPVPIEEVIDDGLMAIQRAMVLKKAGIENAADEDFLLNPPNRADLLESAIKNIIRYLQVSRHKDLNPEVKEGVDTLLMYLYRALEMIDQMEQLASSPNNCVVEEIEKWLDNSRHLRALAFLYSSKGMWPKALAIWRLLARNYTSGFRKSSASFTESVCVDVSADSVSDQQDAAVEASKLLQETSDQDLVLEHLGWIAEVNQELAVTVITSDRRDIDLSPDEVLAAIDPKKVSIRQRYLQWLIEDQEADDTRFHTLYALSLAKTALEMVQGSKRESTDSKSSPMKENSNAEIIDYDTYSVRIKLQQFLQASDFYDPEEVLYVIEGSELWLEKAILYRKMGQESMVLQILALKLEDYEAAEQYCVEIGRDDAFLQLLDMYLNPKNGREPMFKAAVRLLHNHGVSLDPLQVLEKLSPVMPLQLASDTISRMLRARHHHYRQGQIVHNLSRAVNLDAQLAKFEERSRHVEINDESICHSCYSRLGTKLFAMYPDDSVVCYKCYRRLGESTSTRGRNFKQNPIFKPGWLVNR